MREAQYICIKQICRELTHVNNEAALILLIHTGSGFIPHQCARKVQFAWTVLLIFTMTGGLAILGLERRLGNH